ncbi:MAG: protein phosphatase CheZ [Gammaproteobacteria bacterium]|nr:protein phosphatase CheZ [Gammaproteobacteria bacterium]
MQSEIKFQQDIDNDSLLEMIQQYAILVKDDELKEAEIVLQTISQLTEMTMLSIANSQAESKLDKYEHGSTNDDLYSKVGKLTRDLHDSLNNFLNDASLDVMTNEAMPDARNRLNYVIELTEKSAHETMTLIENSGPLIRILDERASVLIKQYQEHESCNNKYDFLNDETKAFLHLVTSSAKTVNSDLNKIMLTQNYQDLTGQVINRVSSLVQEVENNLLTLLKFSSEHIAGEHEMKVNCDNSKVFVNSDVKDKKDNRGFGPFVPGSSNGDVIESQEDVDDLLSSLGF